MERQSKFILYHQKQITILLNINNDEQKKKTLLKN